MATLLLSVIQRGGNASQSPVLFPAYFTVWMEPDFLDVINTAWYLACRSLLNIPVALQAGTTGWGATHQSPAWSVSQRLMTTFPCRESTYSPRSAGATSSGLANNLVSTHSLHAFSNNSHFFTIVRKLLWIHSQLALVTFNLRPQLAFALFIRWIPIIIKQSFLRSTSNVGQLISQPLFLCHTGHGVSSCKISDGNMNN